ncbi:MAG: dephospho-CoA kinase [Deltaproteobacteria bacterium]
MLKIGITGGIGSGKTTVSRIFEMLGIPVYNADREAKKLMTHDKVLKNRIIKLLGTESFTKDELNREYIASKVFNDKDLLKKINSIVHPVVKEDFVKWTENQNGPYVLYEAALMVESGNYRLMDKIIVVTAPIELRIGRVCQRDKVDVDKASARINNQLSQEEMLKFADHVINNDGSSSLIRQVLELDKIFTSYQMLH